MALKDDPPQARVEQFVLAAHGNFQRVKEMHEERPDLINMKWEKFDENALEAAGHTGRREIAEYLVVHGAPPTIFSAAMLGQTDKVTAILKKDRTLAGTPGVHGFSVMYHAALSGNTSIADLLLDSGGNQGMEAALQAATKFGHLEMVRWLLGHGATPNGIDFEGKTPLRVAGEAGDSAIANLLRTHGGKEQPEG